MPIDPFYEQARRQLEDQLQAALAQITAQRPEMMASNNLFMQRLATNQGIDTHQLNASLAGHGIFNSGIRTVDTGRLNTQYDRQRQDQAFQLAQSLAGLSQQASTARLGFNQGIAEARLESARRLGSDPYAVLPHYRKPPGPIPKLPNRRR